MIYYAQDFKGGPIKIGVAEVLSEILETPINRAYAQLMRKLEGDE